MVFFDVTESFLLTKLLQSFTRSLLWLTSLKYFEFRWAWTNCEVLRAKWQWCSVRWRLCNRNWQKPPKRSTHPCQIWRRNRSENLNLTLDVKAGIHQDYIYRQSPIFSLVTKVFSSASSLPRTAARRREEIKIVFLTSNKCSYYT